MYVLHNFSINNQARKHTEVRRRKSESHNSCFSSTFITPVVQIKVLMETLYDDYLFHISFPPLCFHLSDHSQGWSTACVCVCVFKELSMRNTWATDPQQCWRKSIMFNTKVRVIVSLCVPPQSDTMGGFYFLLCEEKFFFFFPISACSMDEVKCHYLHVHLKSTAENYTSFE